MYKAGDTKRGFTLIELLIVIAIIAILALIAIPNFLEAQTRSKTSRTKADMRSIAIAMEAYYVDSNNYPLNCGSSEIGSFRFLTTPVAYITSIPVDVFNLRNPDPKRRYFVYGRYTNPDWNGTAWTDQSGNATIMAKINLQNQSGIFWSFSSYGPDLDDDQLWNVDNIVSPVECANRGYDPTNGTISNGDICMTAKGFIPFK